MTSCHTKINKHYFVGVWPLKGILTTVLGLTIIATLHTNSNTYYIFVWEYRFKMIVLTLVLFYKCWIILKFGVLEARLCWLLLATLLLLNRTLSGLLVSCSLTCCLLLRPHNTLLPPVLLLYSQVMSTHSKAISETVDLGASTVLHHWLGAVFFFYQGNSNSLASVDVATGYIGLTEYNAVVVATQLSMHTYGMPVMAYLLNVQQVIIKARNWRLELTRSVELVTYLQLVHVTVCLVVITLQRYHLFVWTVFSPKLLYVVVQTFIFFLLVSITNGCTFLSSLLRRY